MTSSEVIAIPVDRIAPDPSNLRTVFDPEDLRALAENLREVGQLDPIQVFEGDGGSYDLLDGERRWRAAKLAQMPTLNGIIVPKPTATDLLCKKISRFMQTRDLTFPEQVRALEEGLKALSVLDQPQQWTTAAKKFGIQSAQLRERMRITNLAPDLRKTFEEGQLDYSVSQSLGRISDFKLQRKAADFIVKEKLSNRFVAAQFIPAVLEQPGRSLMESYDVAKHREKYRYAAPRKSEGTPMQVEDRLDEMLSDFRKCLRWMEEAGKQDLISHLTPENFNTRRVLTTIRHLYHLQAAFMSAYAARYGAEDNSGVSVRPKRKKRELTGITKLLEAATGETDKSESHN